MQLRSLPGEYLGTAKQENLFLTLTCPVSSASAPPAAPTAGWDPEGLETSSHRPILAGAFVSVLDREGARVGGKPCLEQGGNNRGEVYSPADNKWHLLPSSTPGTLSPSGAMTETQLGHHPLQRLDHQFRLGLNSLSQHRRIQLLWLFH